MKEIKSFNNFSYFIHLSLVVNIISFKLSSFNDAIIFITSCFKYNSSYNSSNS